MSVPLDNPKAGWKLEVEHSEDCFCQNDKDGLVFIVLDRQRPANGRLKQNGHRGGSTMWFRFVCNDIDCPARMLVRWDTLARFVSNPPAPSDGGEQ